ncbi:MAG: Gfo/Idh/MocA family oxidoreductase [Devosia sp.]|nr:Gfo/Idh/MocA family oxidoreductase [Devosia sp.]
MAADRKVGVGIIGAGNISPAYIKAMQGFSILDIRGIADMKPEAAAARAAEFGLEARTIDELLADPAISIIVNLTIPRAHVEVGLRAIAAGKHVHGEKPLGITFAEGKGLVDAAKARGLRVGSAPDTFLGGSHQQCRQLIDAGKVGRVVGGTAFFACPGHERWHPDPAFYYDVGGGPVLDMGPYYITDLVNLLGPVASVMAASATPQQQRMIYSEPKRGQMMPVRVATHVAGILTFRSGALIQVTLSFDVPAHAHLPFELYGTEATLLVPDPNIFGGEIRTRTPVEKEWRSVPTTLPYADGNYRSLGVADLAAAILDNRPHRASGELALHVLEVMEGFGRSSEAGRPVEMSTTVERPEPLATSLVDGKVA